MTKTFLSDWQVYGTVVKVTTLENMHVVIIEYDDGNEQEIQVEKSIPVKVGDKIEKQINWFKV